MNIFEQYLDKIKEILSTLSSNGDLILPDSLNGITAEIPPSKFDSCLLYTSDAADDC